MRRIKYYKIVCERLVLIFHDGFVIMYVNMLTKRDIIIAMIMMMMVLVLVIKVVVAVLLRLRLLLLLLLLRSSRSSSSSSSCISSSYGSCKGNMCVHITCSK